MPCRSPHCLRYPATDDDSVRDGGRDDDPGIDKDDDTFARNDKYRKAGTSSDKNRSGNGSAGTSDENHYVDVTTQDNGGRA